MGKSWRIFSTSKRTLAAVLMEPLKENLFQPLAQRLEPDALEDVAREGGGQNIAGLVSPDAARLEVKQGFRVELPDGGAVRAAHVVGPDLQLGLGVDDSVLGKDQVFVGLLGVGLLRVLADVDLTVEDRRGVAVQNA